MTVDINHIVFDIGRVLLHYDPELAFLAVIPDPAERRDFLATVCTNTWNVEQDRGRSWADAEAILLAEHPTHEEWIRAFRRNWRLMVPHALDDSVAIYEALLAEGRDVTLLTNFAPHTYAEAREIFPFLDRARGVTVSGAVGIIKPDPAIYVLHAETFGLSPSHTLFIDDSVPNVLGARAAGWHAIHFTAPAALRGELARFGIGV